MTDLLLNDWHNHPEVLIGITALQGFYLLGIGPVREKFQLASNVNPREIASFTAGTMVLMLSLLSPLHILSNEYLFSAHMLQHVLLTLIVPPLLIIGLPIWLIRPLVRPKFLFIAFKFLTTPIAAFALFNLSFSMWHIPALYNLSMTNHNVHVIEHILFVSTGILMWWPITSKLPELPRLNYPVRMIYLFMLSLAQIIVFGPIAFAGNPIYEWYAQAPRIWSISPLVDQQIGAIIMKIGGGSIFMTLIITSFFSWYRNETRNPVKTDRLETATQPDLNGLTDHLKTQGKGNTI